VLYSVVVSCAKVPVNFLPKLPAALKTEVEQTFGRPVFTFKDCIQLSDEIYVRTKVQVSPSTLRRLFGLVKANSDPSKSTLNILAKYCGFHSVGSIPEVPDQGNHTWNIGKENILYFLVHLFEEVPMHDMKQEAYLVLLRHTLLILNRDEQLARDFQRYIAKTLNGQLYYFEQFVHLDKLDNYYGDGLRYYVNEKSTPEAECFAYALLVLRYWLTEENEKLFEAYKHIEKYSGFKFRTADLMGRYYAACLLHSYIIGEPRHHTLNELRKMHESFCKGKVKAKDFPFFEYLLSAALVLTGQYAEALYYIHYALENYLKHPLYEGLGYYAIIYLLKGIAHVGVGERRKAEKIYSTIKPAEFGFHTKKFSTLLFLLLAYKLKKKVHGKEEQLAALVQDTGFKRFISLVH
jgi:hypothetical protein